MQDQPNKTIDEVIDNALTAAFEGYDTQNSPPEGESEFDRAAEYQSCSAKDTESISDNELETKRSNLGGSEVEAKKVSENLGSLGKNHAPSFILFVCFFICFCFVFLEK